MRFDYRLTLGFGGRFFLTSFVPLSPLAVRKTLNPAKRN
jgi:hypothetical protein